MEDILFTQEGQLGLITLNRPAALNALTLTMIQDLQKQLELWKNDDRVKAVAICSAPGKAFCAGGDVRWLYHTGQTKAQEQLQFFWHEYRLNHYIHHLGKPYIALMDGITMGGGVGVSLHGSHSVGSEHFVFAMPETSIGFFPDIGASHLLSRCSGNLGIYLGLTGNRIGVWDALDAGLIQHVVSSTNMQRIVEDLVRADLSETAHQTVSECINVYASASSKPPNTELTKLIDHCFSNVTVELIQESLRGFEDDWAKETAQGLEQKSPISLKVTLTQLQKAKGLSLAECLKMDFDLVKHFMQGCDFYEGVRALLIEKDKTPKWNPQRLEEVSDEMVVSYFEPCGKELGFKVGSML
jgi:enoyl-CoA hydratase/carnithine racemase